MGVLNWLRSLFRRQPVDPDLIYILLPGRIEPIERGDRFEDPLIDDPEFGRLAKVSGGGSQMGPKDDEGRSFVIFAGIDVDTYMPDETRAYLRQRLPELSCPDGTELHFSKGEARLQDEYVQGEWRLDQPRTRLHPGFGI